MPMTPPIHQMLLTNIKPMLASPPKKEDLRTLVGSHTFDTKLDGVRVILYWTGAACKLVNRSGVDVTAQYPEVMWAAEKLGPLPVILDGEVVAKSGSFQDTSKRAKQNRATDIVATMALIPVVFVAFDLLLLDDIDCRPLPYLERRVTLESLLILDPTIQVSPIGHDLTFVDTVKQLGMEGVIAKRNNAPYRSGRFSDWVKFKNLHSITCIGIGYEKGEGARAHFGAMFLALIGPDGPVEVGRVGTGFDNAEITVLKDMMDAGVIPLVEIECLNKSKDNKLRFPVYKGLRGHELSLADATLAQLDTIPTM